MAIERWGSLSVRDHINTDALITNVLLYDRLVLPVPDGIEGLACWSKEKWEPHRQQAIVDTLGDLAVTRRWNTGRENAYRKLAFATNLDLDVAQVLTEKQQELPYHNTRMVLAQEEVLKLPDGVASATVVAGYNSAAEFSEDCKLKTMGNGGEVEHQLAMVFRNEVVIPVMDNPEEALKRAVGLSLQKDYRAKRQEYYEWQRQLIATEVRADVAVKEMNILVKDYNSLAEKAIGKVKKKFAFTVSGIALSLSGAWISGNPLPAVGAFLSFMSYKTFNDTPTIVRDACQPAAMFHDARNALSR